MTAMKVLHVYRTYFPDSQGGAQEVIRQICRSTKSLGFENRVFTLSPNPHPSVIYSDEAQVIRIKQNFEIASCGFGFTEISEFRRQTQWADIIHYHFPWPFADILHSLVNSSKPSVVTYHSDIVRQRVLMWFYQPLMKRFLDSVSTIVATSPNYLESSAVLPRYKEKSVVIPIGLDRASYPQVDMKSEAAKQVTAKFGEAFFLFIGVLRYYKGLHILLDAIKNADFHVVIVGSGPLENELKSQAIELGLDNVTFAGYVDDLTKITLLQLCSALVLPSHLRSEAFGVSLIEGAMFGKPLISAEIGTGTTHINIDQETGLVVTPECPESLRKAMDTLHANPEKAEQLGDQAKKRFEKHFTGKEMGGAYANVYKETVNH
jgi:glycosyltransferase involved in cell wall biosynthesis